MKMLYWWFSADSRLLTMLFNENPFAAGSASGLCPEYSNSVRGYQCNCHGCYWQNPIIASTYIAARKRTIQAIHFLVVYLLIVRAHSCIHRLARPSKYSESNNMLIIGLVTILHVSLTRLIFKHIYRVEIAFVNLLRLYKFTIIYTYVLNLEIKYCSCKEVERLDY